LYIPLSPPLALLSQAIGKHTRDLYAAGEAPRLRAGELYRGVPQLAEAYERSFEGQGLRQDGSPRAVPAGAEPARLALFTTADRTPNYSKICSIYFFMENRLIKNPSFSGLLSRNIRHHNTVYLTSALVVP